MAGIDKRFYQGRIALNVLAKDIPNAVEVFKAAEGYVLIGVLSKAYATVQEAVSAMQQYDDAIEGAVSIGLGAGDHRQAAVVAEIVKHYPGSHINQVFPAVGATRANLGGKEGWINCLVSPSGEAGYVNISTGPQSSGHADRAIVPVRAAIALAKDMGGNALKYFPMNGLACEEEYREVARACAEEGFALEPTGGIDHDNFEAIVRIALEAGVHKLIPHVYSSIIDPVSGETRIEDVRRLLNKVKRLAEAYA